MALATFKSPRIEAMTTTSNYCGRASFRRGRRCGETDIFRQIGFFDEAFWPADDWDMYLRVARSFPIYCHNELVLQYRRHGANATEDAARMLEVSLALLQAQSPFVESTPADSEAWLYGMETARRYYGELLAQHAFFFFFFCSYRSSCRSWMRNDFWKRRWQSVLAQGTTRWELPPPRRWHRRWASVISPALPTSASRGRIVVPPARRRGSPGSGGSEESGTQSGVRRVCRFP